MVDPAVKYKCEECELKEAVLYCSSCTIDQGEDPFLYCQECSDTSHKGRKCRHSLHTIVNIDEVRKKMKEVVDSLQCVVDDADRVVDQETEKITKLNESVTDTQTALLQAFSELRALIDTKEKELLNQCSTIRDMKLSDAQMNAKFIREETDSARSTIESVNSDVENVLVSSSPYETEQAVTRLTTQLKDKEKSLKCVISQSAYPKLSTNISFIPDRSHIIHSLTNYSLPYKGDWKEGDTVVVMATNSSVTNQGCFWLCESHSESVQFDLYHISQSLRTMMSDPDRGEIDEDLKPGMLCCAYHSAELSWHRGIIEKTIEKKRKGDSIIKFFVRYLDYGNTEELIPYNVAMLPDKFTDYPFQCRQCCFYENVSFDKREVKWKYNDSVMGQSLTTDIMKRTYPVDSTLPLFSVRLFDAYKQNVGAMLSKMTQTVSGPQEPFPKTYRDIRYKETTGTTKPVSPVSRPVVILKCPEVPAAVVSNEDTPSIMSNESPNKSEISHDVEVKDHNGRTSVTRIPPGFESHFKVQSSSDDLIDKEKNQTSMELSPSNQDDQISKMTTEVKDQIDTSEVKHELKLNDKDIDQVKDQSDSKITDEINRVKDEVDSELTDEINQVKDQVDSELTDEINQVKDQVDSELTDEINQVKDQVDSELTDEINQVKEQVDSESNQEIEQVKDQSGHTDQVNDQSDLEVVYISDCEDNPEIKNQVDLTSKVGETDTVLISPDIGSEVFVYTSNDKQNDKLHLHDKAELQSQELPISSQNSSLHEECTTLSEEHNQNLFDNIHLFPLPSSSCSSLGPFSSPSQIISQSQTSTSHSHTPSCNDDGELRYEESDSEINPITDTPLDSATDDDLEVGKSLGPVPMDMTFDISDLKMNVCKSTPNLALDLSGILPGSNNEVDLSLSRDYVPPLHHNVIPDAKLSLLVNSCLTEEGIFWAQLLIEEEDNDYNTMFEELQTYATTKGQYTPVFFVPGDLCMAVFSEDEMWYRGRVEEGGEKKFLFVRFLDFGNYDLVNLTNVMALKTTFRKLPFQAIQCSLATEEKTAFTEEECYKFDELFDNDNSISAKVISVCGDIVSVKAEISQSRSDLFQKVTGCYQYKTRTYSFEMAPDEDTQGMTWAEQMDTLINPGLSLEDGINYSDSEVIKKRQRDKKKAVQTDIEDPLSCGEMIDSTKEDCTKNRERSRKEPQKSLEDRSSPVFSPPVNQISEERSRHLSSSSSVSSRSSSTRLSVDTSGVTKFLSIGNTESSEGNGEKNGKEEPKCGKPPSPVERDSVGKGKDEYRDNRLQSKGSNQSRYGSTSRGNGGGSGRGWRTRGVQEEQGKNAWRFGRSSSFQKSWNKPDYQQQLRHGTVSGEDWDTNKGTVSNMYRTPSPRSPFSSSSFNYSKRGGHYSNPKSSKVTLHIHRLPCGITKLEVYELLKEYGHIYDIRAHKRQDDLFFVDMDRTNAATVRDNLNGKRINDKTKPLQIIIQN